MTLRHTPWDTPPYDFAIGLKPINEDAWLEGGDAEAARKAGLLATAPSQVWGEIEGSGAGQAEVLALVEAATDLKAGEGPPLWAASLLCADDLCLMEQRDGQWRLTAVSLCSPTFFTVEDALGKSLVELHGPVPDFADSFLPRVERMFDAVAPGVIMERRNWTVVHSGEAGLPRKPVYDPAVDDLFIRIERQTVRKLPESGAVLFTIRAWRDPLASLANDRVKKAAFAAAWRGASQGFRAYKGLGVYDERVEAFLTSG